jgi:hypothetical protein
MPTKKPQITGWINPGLKLKERMRRLKELDHRMTESRIVEEADAAEPKCRGVGRRLYEAKPPIRWGSKSRVEEAI